MTDQLDLEIVATYQSRFEAEVAVAHLASEGIEANIRPFGGGAGAPNLGFTDGVPVLVHSADLEAARRILNEEPTDTE